MDLKIALLAGDGIGPEVIREAVKVSNSIAKKFNHKITWTEGLVGAAAIELTGDPYPEETHKICINQMSLLHLRFVFKIVEVNKIAFAS